MAGHIDCYMDISSYYSFLAFVFLLKHREVLATHDVSVDFHPIFLGGVNVSTGNKPPWTLPAKKSYGAFETKRAQKYFGVPDIQAPEFFPILSILVRRSSSALHSAQLTWTAQPLRALCYIKATFPQSTFEQAWLAFFRASWIPPHANLSQQAISAPCWASDAILAAAQEKQWKDRLLENNTKVLELGAFGAPWMWVRNAQGKEEPFFGSDRFHFVWEYLGLPWKDFELLPRQAKL
ncbi:putative glutathione S-transferase kappa 1 [Mycena leptocephala]|nr:putative glutathione S-transferase kappa 1 [Mycena leptocephala]